MRTLRLLAVPIAAAALHGCGGGGSSADVRPGETPPVQETGPNSFLLFPNPQKQADGTLQTDTIAYADAYYRAIDPTGSRDTFAKWKAANGFETGTGNEVSVVFGDKRDLGYGRRMTVRQNADGTVAAYVQNYVIQAGPGYSYSAANLDAAIQRDDRWIVGISALEFSPGPGGGVSFAKFYNFGSDGARQLLVDVDGRGDKAMPGPCITCHGGRGDPLTPAADGTPLFAKVESAPSGHRGDTLGHMPPLEPDAFDFSTRPGFTRAEQEAAIKAINRIILCTYPIASVPKAPEDACRRAAHSGEWAGTAAQIIKSGYGGDGLPDATFSGDAVPVGWTGHEALYRDVVVPSCRECHALRGTTAQGDIDFASYAKLAGYADRTAPHVYDRGDMPLAKIVYDAFWNDSTRPSELADFLAANGVDVHDAAGNVKRPGRPIADPGPDRVVTPGTTALSADASLFANGYSWSVVSGPSGATLSDASASHASFSATTPGRYTLQLVASRGDVQGEPAQLHIVVDPTLHPAPSDIRFVDIKAALQASRRCSGCHSPAFRGPTPPVFFSDEDRNGDGSIDAADDDGLYAVVRGEANFTDIAASPLLRKPSGHHHLGQKVAGFDASAAPGDSSRALYDLFLNWILNGAPR